jgi:hypothetical protein
MLAYHFHQDSPTPGLDELIERQRQNGGRLIQYRRAWAAIAVVATQDRIEWVPFGRSRDWAGWRHSLYTTVLGIWSLMSIFAVPMILFSNFRGGIDVTEFYSESATDPLRSSLPQEGTAAREAKQAEWAMLGFLALVLAIVLFLVLR